MNGLNRFHLELLALIDTNDSKWSWYQLDRAFDVSRLPDGTKFIDLLHHLENDSLIEAVQGNEGMPSKYRITANGRAMLARSRSI